MQLSNPLILHSSSFTPRFPCTHNPTRISSRVSARPTKREPAAPSDPKTEAQELVRHLLRSFSGKEPIVRTLHRHVRDIRTHHCFLLFEELGRTDKWLQCLEVFRWMQKQRWYVADNGVYSKLISVMGKRGQTRMAMWLFSEMRTSGCKPDTSVYNALITAHLHSTDKDKALTKALVYYEKLKGMPRCQPNVVTYNILLRASAQARNVAQVKALFDDLGKSAMDPDVYTFNGVIDAYGKNGMISEMEAVLARMKDTNCKPDIVTFNSLIDSYGKKQEFAKMEQVFRSLMRSKEKPTLPTFNSMILSYGKARLKEKAESVYEKLRDMNYTPSFVTYESLITMYGICDCVSKARDIFDDLAMPGKEVRVSTMNVMLDAYCKNGLHVEAHALLENARSMHVMPDTATYKLLFRAYTKADMKMLMGKLLKNMDRDGIVPSKSFFLETRGVDSRSPKASSSRKPRTGSSGRKEEAKTLVDKL